MRLIDYAKVLRSKNAGPLWLTLDVIFDAPEKLKRVLPQLQPEIIAVLYDVDAADVSVIPYEIVNSVKITIPRKIVSGDLQDDDIYGCQQHMPLAGIEIPEDPS